MRVMVRSSLAGLLMLPLPLIAAEQAATAADKISASPLSGGVLFETVGGLLLVIALIVALAWGLRRFGAMNIGGKGDISVLGGVSLGPRERAVLLKVGQTRLLVGVAPGRVQTLHVLDADELLGEKQDSKAFDDRLKNEMGGEKS